MHSISWWVIASACVLVGACASGGAGESTTPAAASAADGAESKPEFGTGVVELGMCPDEAIAAAGNPGPYMVRRDTEKWPPGTFPPTIVAAQCEHPDDSVIELLFRNRSQYATEEPVVFRVKFERGKAVSIDQVRAR
ncbi:MAG: hypothetical protein OXT09_28170 [Myxococcales bacterium]|nr:hypothetical protein [Myxococcales bacterium]